MVHKRKYRYLVQDLSSDGDLVLYEKEPEAYVAPTYTTTTRPETRYIRPYDPVVVAETPRSTDDKPTTYTKPKETNVDSGEVQTASIFPNIKPLYLIIGFAVLVGAGYLYKAVKKP